MKSAENNAEKKKQLNYKLSRCNSAHYSVFNFTRSAFGALTRWPLVDIHVFIFDEGSYFEAFIMGGFVREAFFVMIRGGSRIFYARTRIMQIKGWAFRRGMRRAVRSTAISLSAAHPRKNNEKNPLTYFLRRHKSILVIMHNSRVSSGLYRNCRKIWISARFPVCIHTSLYVNPLKFS